MPEASKSHIAEAKCIDVAPTSLEKLTLGTFPDRKLIPEYQFDFLPDLPDAMGVSKTVTETKDGFYVVWHFQNYSQQTVAVFPRKKIA